MRRLRVMMLSLGATAAGTPATLGQNVAVPRQNGDRAGAERRTEPAAPARELRPGPRSPDQAPNNGQPPPPSAGDLLKQNGNSLLRASLASTPDPYQAQLKDVSYYAIPAPEPKVIRRHDLVTIIVREESSYSSDASNETKRESSLDAALTDFIKLRLKNLEIEGGGIGPVAPRVGGNANREFKGEGTVDRADRFTARITAEVLDVKPNGTLVLQARKRIKTDEEEQIFTLTGTCRAEDITADNTVLSTALHDQELTKTHKGTVRNATRKGWGGKLLDAISPF